MKNVLVRQVLGKVNGYMCVIEFQKLGLPHAHCLLILHDDDASKSADDFDLCVCSEIPDKKIIHWCLRW